MSRRRGDAWTGPLWPIHFKPLPDELLSSWVMRLAYSHGLKAQTFAYLLAGDSAKVWNRDIDRLAPPWLIDALSKNTAVPVEAIRKTSLRAYQGILYRSYRERFIVPWVLPLQMYSSTRTGFGLQFCPRCLAEDAQPYFRKRWRLALATWCPEHDAMLYDRCPNCGASVAFHRRDAGHQGDPAGVSIAECHVCRFDLRQASAVTPVFHNGTAKAEFESALSKADSGRARGDRAALAYFNLLHHFGRLMGVKYRNVHLLAFACRQMGAPELSLSDNRRAILERRGVIERHHLLQAACWYIADVESRVTSAWKAGAVTYSALLQDFKGRPDAYHRLVSTLAGWRRRSWDDLRMWQHV